MLYGVFFNRLRQVYIMFMSQAEKYPFFPLSVYTKVTLRFDETLKGPLFIFIYTPREHINHFLTQSFTTSYSTHCYNDFTNQNE